jgi:hypothetical protein
MLENRSRSSSTTRSTEAMAASSMGWPNRSPQRLGSRPCDRLPLGGAGGAEPSNDHCEVVRDVLDATVEQRTPGRVGIKLNAARAGTEPRRRLASKGRPSRLRLRRPAPTS